MTFDIKIELDDFGKAAGRYSICNYHDELVDLFVSTAIESSPNTEQLYCELMTKISSNEALALVYCDLLCALLDNHFDTKAGLKISHEQLKYLSEQSIEGYLGTLKTLFKYKSEVAEGELEKLSQNSTNERVKSWATRILSLRNEIQDENSSRI